MSPLDEVFHHEFRHGRAANIAMADEEKVDHRYSFWIWERAAREGGSGKESVSFALYHAAGAGHTENSFHEMHGSLGNE